MNKSKIKLSVKRVVNGNTGAIVDLISLKELGKPTQSACVYMELANDGTVKYSSKAFRAADVIKEKTRRYHNELFGYQVLREQGWHFDLKCEDEYVKFILQLDEILLGGWPNRGEESVAKIATSMLRKFERAQDVVGSVKGKAPPKNTVLTDNELTGAWG
ncbi:hypothetical protein N5J31_01525 [Acinetobacter johnsonii]|uniref:hypothetical protein n=1 Tax=Acinetobacter johnsonii TaxID=40214 RepID=UPI00244C5CB6|nr:hypothetical protein [Acinetobacter johnsonii]MDH2045606.1 hypothetical protein [Acinetobacter johnsonii]